jgi:hypothetical protein
MQFLISINRKKILLCHDYSFMKSNYKLKSVLFLHISTSQVSLCFKFVFKKYSLNIGIFHPFWEFQLSSLIFYCSMYNIFPNIHSWITLFMAYMCVSPRCICNSAECLISSLSPSISLCMTQLKNHWRDSLKI